MRRALVNYSSTPTSVTVKADPRQVANNTGGFVYQASDDQRLRRFLVLGTMGGSYYASEQSMLEDNISAIREMIQTNEANVLRTLIDVSTNALAPKHSPTLFVLASVFQYGTDWKAARSAFTSIVRTATHLFEFITYAKKLGGFGPKKRKAVAEWFTSKTRDQLAYQSVKYRQRDGWTLRDVLRVARPHASKMADKDTSFILHGTVSSESPEIIQGFTAMSKAVNLKQVLNILSTYPNLPWETIPTQFLREPKVWDKLFRNGQLTGQALIRNIKRLDEIGAFQDSVFVSDVAMTLENEVLIAKTKLHPVNYLNAIAGNTEFPSYSRGMRRGTLPTRIAAALEEGFYRSFKNVVPSGKKLLLALDISASMTDGKVAGTQFTPAVGGALMAMQLLRTEQNAEIVGYGTRVESLNLKANMNLEKVVSEVSAKNFGGTNPSLAIDYMRTHGNDFDALISITDNEVNHGTHPSQSIKRYREGSGRDGRMVVVGMTATRFSMGDPLDTRSLDVVGFSSDAPRIITDFVGGRI